MGTPAFEVVIDHHDPRHHERMNALLKDLQAWATRHGVTQLQREEVEVRPGVTRLRFTPAARPSQARPARDRLTLSRR